MSQQDMNPKQTRPRIVRPVYIVLAVLFIAAAFVAGRLLNTGKQAIGEGGPADGQAFALEIIPALELPDSPPDVTGLFSRAEDNSIFVQDDSGDFSVTVNEDSKVNMEANGTGEETEIVIAAETTVYREMIEQPSDPSAALSSGKIQQNVELSTIDQLGENSFISAWGQRRGDRLVANVLVFSTPVFIQAPGKGAP